MIDVYVPTAPVRRNLVAALACLAALFSFSGSVGAQGVVLVSPEEYEAIPIIPAPLGMAALPKRHDLSAFLPLPGNQGPQSSCTAWAVAYGLKTYQESMELGRPPKRPEHVFSPAYLYNQMIAHRSPASCDTGTSIPAALELLKNDGAATVAEFPYDASTCNRLPTLQVQADARRWRIADWGRVGLDQPSMKGHLASGRPVVISMCTGRDFKRQGPGVFHGDSDDVVVVTANNRLTCRGTGHAMLVTGYEDDLGAYRVLNSWGEDWGDGGYAWLSYDAFERQVRGGYVAWDLPTWDPEEREAELAREAAAAEARADSAETRMRAVERRLRVAEERFAEHLRMDSTEAALRRAAARDDYPRAITYEEHMRVGAPRLMADRVAFVRLHPRDDGFLESLGGEDVKGYLHELPCGPRLRLSWGTRERLTEDRTELGAGHLRDTESSHVQAGDDNGRDRNFRFELRGGRCYLLLAEAYDDDTGPYTLRVVGRARFTYTTYGVGGWTGFSEWGLLPEAR